VLNGIGTGNYPEGAQVSIIANIPSSEMVFDRWTTSGGGSFANINASTTVFTMPAHGTTVTALYREVPVIYSNDATLYGLTVSSGALTPSFSATTTAYTVNVTHDVDRITISATANHSAATLVGTGEKSLVVGKNSFSVVVTAEDGRTHTTYDIIITRDVYSHNEDVQIPDVKVWSIGKIIHIDSPSAGTIMVYNLSGNCLYRGKKPAGEFEISLSFSSGVLVVEVGESTRKIFIK
jgi:hypothetical protein